MRELFEMALDRCCMHAVANRMCTILTCLLSPEVVHTAAVFSGFFFINIIFFSVNCNIIDRILNFAKE